MGILNIYDNAKEAWSDKKLAVELEEKDKNLKEHSIESSNNANALIVESEKNYATAFKAVEDCLIDTWKVVVKLHTLDAFPKVQKSDDVGLETKLSNFQLADSDTPALEAVLKGSTGALGALGAYSAVGIWGTASTGAAIGGLSGVAATNASLAWFGGGALAAGGGGMVAGTAILSGIIVLPVAFVAADYAKKHYEEKKQARAKYLTDIQNENQAIKTQIEFSLSVKKRVDNKVKFCNHLEQRAKLYRGILVKVISRSSSESMKEEDRLAVDCCVSNIQVFTEKLAEVVSTSLVLESEMELSPEINFILNEVQPVHQSTSWTI